MNIRSKAVACAALLSAFGVLFISSASAQVVQLPPGQEAALPCSPSVTGEAQVGMRPVYDPKDAQIPCPGSVYGGSLATPAQAQPPVASAYAPAPVFGASAPAIAAASPPIYNPTPSAPITATASARTTSLVIAPTISPTTIHAAPMVTAGSSGGLTCDGVWSAHANNDRDGDGRACEMPNRTPSIGATSAARSYGGSGRVRGYYRKDGTYVRSHTRRARRR